jgi:hypothetical protein
MKVSTIVAYAKAAQRALTQLAEHVRYLASFRIESAASVDRLLVDLPAEVVGVFAAADKLEKAVLTDWIGAIMMARS